MGKNMPWYNPLTWFDSSPSGFEQYRRNEQKLSETVDIIESEECPNCGKPFRRGPMHTVECECLVGIAVLTSDGDTTIEFEDKPNTT